ncbi:MAG: YIP1 family protein [Candidatus Melainabacteria bacterium]|nr:YIP1 family protein [Candidatus Melainabacteria bacterium]
MASGDDNKKKEGEDDLLSHLPGYTPFSAQQQALPGQQQQPAGPPPTNNPWFPHQEVTSQPPSAYPVSAGYVGPAEPIGPTGIELPKLRPQDDPNSAEYIPRTPVLNAPAPDPSSPWIPVPEPKWDLFAEEQPQRPQQRPPQQLERKTLPAGGSQANALPFNSLPIVTGPSYSPEAPTEPVWPGQQQAAMPGQQAPTAQAQPGAPESAQFNQKQQANINLQLQQNQQPGWPNANPNSRNQNQQNLNYDQEQQSPKLRSKLFGNATDQLKEVPPPSIGLSFSKNDIIGIATYNLNVTKDILTNPKAYFQNLPLTGGYGEPLLYLVFTLILSSLMFAVSKLNPLLFFWGMIIGFLSVSVGAVITDLAFKRLGGKGDLEGTFRVLAFSKATFVFAWIALGQISLGAMLATMGTGYMCYIGLMRVQGLSPKSTLIIVAVLSALSMLFRISCPGI